jgi:hypothetical protein
VRLLVLGCVVCAFFVLGWVFLGVCGVWFMVGVAVAGVAGGCFLCVGLLPISLDGSGRFSRFVTSLGNLGEHGDL